MDGDVPSRETASVKVERMWYQDLYSGSACLK